MSANIFGVFSFSSSHYAIASEKLSSILPEARLIPVPPEISAGCGLALRVNEKNIEIATKYLNENEIPFEEVSKLEIKNRKRLITKL